MQANSTTPLVVITQLQPITVIFSVAEDYLPQIQQQLRQGHRCRSMRSTARSKNRLPPARCLTLDNQIDTTTGTIKLKAVFENKDEFPFPQPIRQCQASGGDQHEATLIPAAAIQRNGQGAFIYHVKSDQTALCARSRSAPPTALPPRSKGVKPGDVVATNDFDNCRTDAK